jgi:hypothetical protein
VLVVGEVEEPSTWTDREGNTRASLEVTARNVQFLSTRAESEALSGGGWGQSAGPGAPTGGGSDAEAMPDGRSREIRLTITRARCAARSYFLCVGRFIGSNVLTSRPTVRFGKRAGCAKTVQTRTG